MPIDENTSTELEAAAFRRLVEHMRKRTDVQNIDLMNLAGFCRNCLSNWMKEAADAQGIAVSKDESREAVYGMPYEEWKTKHQGAERRTARGDEEVASRALTAPSAAWRDIAGPVPSQAGRIRAGHDVRASPISCGRAVDDRDVS